MAGVGGRGWAPVVGLAVVTVAFSVVHPALLIFVPLALLLLARPPSRRPAMVAAGLLFAALPFLGEPTGVLWYAERGWALVLGAWFLVLVVGRPDWPFLSRALGAVAATLASVAAVALTTRGWERLDWAFGQEFRQGAAQMVSLWSAAGADGWMQDLSAAAYRAADLQAMLYPGLTALASVAALGVGWWAYRRLSSDEARPLGPLREFRFRDELVWLFIGGLVLLLAPVGEWAVRAGSNVVVFMSGLYALRGVAVLLAMVGVPGPLGLAAAVAATVVLYPVVMGAALVVGLTDTWLDFRTRGGEAGGS